MAAAIVPMTVAEREAKKQRLRELRDAHDAVNTIVVHMGKHYRSTDPPPWLDLRVVAAQLMRSTRPTSSHAAWGHLRGSLVSIQTWMEGHSNWKEAVQEKKMPFIGPRSEIKAMEFIEGKQPSMPKCLMQSLTRAELDFLMDAHPRSHDAMPSFWKDSELDDYEWRALYMQKQQGYYLRHLPFKDDLTDLVLSTVCQRSKLDAQEKRRPSGRAEAEDDDDGLESSDDEARTTPIRKGAVVKGNGEAEVWKDKVQATMSRIADTVNETLAVEKVKLLGKRYREDNEKAHPEVHKKLQRTAEEAHRPRKFAETVEDTDDDRSSPSDTVRTAYIAKEEERFRALKSGYKKLKRQDQQLATLYSTLDGSSKELGKEVKRLAQQYTELQKDGNTAKRAHEQLAERCDGIEAQNKGLEDRTQQLAVQNTALTDGVRKLEDSARQLDVLNTALTDDVRKLEDKSGQMAAQCGALEDENKTLRAQIVGLIARVEFLEQTGFASKSQADPTQVAAPRAATMSNQARETERARPRQSSDVMEAPRDSRPRDTGRAAAASIPPPSSWQSNAAVKYETIDSSVMSQPAPLHYKRAGSRFPRVPQMPTFDPSWDPQQEVRSRRAPEYTRTSRPTVYSDIIEEASAPATYALPAIRGAPAPYPSPAQDVTPTFATPVSSFSPEFPVATEAVTFTTATLQPHPLPSPNQFTPTPNQTTPTQFTTTPNHFTGPTQAPTTPTRTTATAASTTMPQPPAALFSLAPGSRQNLLALLNSLDRHLWMAPTHEIVAHCRGSGAVGMDERLLSEAVEWFRKGVLRAFGAD